MILIESSNQAGCSIFVSTGFKSGESSLGGKVVRTIKLTIALCFLISTLAAGGAYGEGPSATDLAKATQNPVSDLISLPFQNNTNFSAGPADRTQNILNIQPVWPVSLSEDWNLITRTILPVMSQPAYAPGEDRTTGLGDTTFTGFLSPKNSGKLIWGVGPVFLLPTATNDALGSDKWGLGPSVVLLTMQGHWVIGSLFSNVWSTGGSGKNDVNLFTWQYFINYNMPDGWYLVSAPIITANWEADNGNEWTVPFGGGVGKIFRLGKQPMNGQISAYYNSVRPDFAPHWQLRAQLQFLFPKK